MTSAETQIIETAISFGFGMLLGMIYDLYRAWLHLKKRRRRVAAIGDMLFWTLAFGLSTTFLLLLNWGELRFYILAAIVAGTTFYLLLLSRVFTPFFAGCAHFVGKMLKKLSFFAIAVFKFITFPFVATAGIIYHIFYTAQKGTYLLLGFFNKIRKNCNSFLKKKAQQTKKLFRKRH